MDKKVYDVTAHVKQYAVVTVVAKNKHDAIWKVICGDYEESDVEWGDDNSRSQFIVESINDVEEVK